MAVKVLPKDEMVNAVGTKFEPSDWIEVTQDRINTFADCTEYHQFIHVDAKAAEKTPFGTTIAHGFLTLSMLSAMIYDGVPDIEGATMGINYGFDKIRFISPVKSGARVRAHFILKALRHPKPTEVTNIWDITVEIEGQERPALIAEWIGRQYF